MKNSTVSIGIVLYNSRRFLPQCLNAVYIQTCPVMEVIAVDNNSTDDTVEFLRKTYPQVRVITNTANKGFSYAQNQAVIASRGEFYFSLNPDAILTPSCVERLVIAMEMDESIGIVTGKIYRLDHNFVIKDSLKTIDSTGLYWTRNLRHFDRGGGQTDTGQYEKQEYVFGATGAACLMRRNMLEDIKCGNEYVDNDFFFGREDADLCWRAQIAGWKVLYAPDAIAYHLRTAVPELRKSLSPVINMHGAKNRFLLQIKNHTFGTWLATFPHAQIRDAGVLLYVMTRERSSLKGLAFVLTHLFKFLRKRKQVMFKKRVSGRYLRIWFKKAGLPYS